MEDVRRYVGAGRDPLGEGATPLCAVVAECADQVVGVAVIRQEEVESIIGVRVVSSMASSVSPSSIAIRCPIRRCTKLSTSS